MRNERAQSIDHITRLIRAGVAIRTIRIAGAAARNGSGRALSARYVAAVGGAWVTVITGQVIRAATRVRIG